MSEGRGAVGQASTGKGSAGKGSTSKGSMGGSPGKDAKAPSLQDLEFLPDPDAIEQRPLGGLTRVLLLLLSAILFGAVTWASVSHVDEIITASGKLVSAVPNLTVQPLETAIVQSIAVKPGQVVKKGQLLASLDPTFAGADQAQVQGLLQQLNERAERITRELRILEGKEPAGGAGPDSKGRALQGELQAARIANYESRTRALDSAIDRLQASLKTNRQDQGMLAQRLKSVAEVEHMQERLVNQNFGAKRQLLEARERRQEIERELLLTKNREQEILKEITTQEADLQAFRNEWRQRLLEEQAEVTKERNNLITQVEKADKRKSLIDLVAPADAVVLEIPQRSVGSVVTAAEVMFSLVPLDSPLQAELKIAARDVGFVKPGDPVKVKLDAFPFQKYGTLKGQITTVSEDAFTKDTDMQTARLGSYYLARVKLESLQLQRKADEVLIRPGSSLVGEIRIGERTVMSYFVYPLIGTLDQSLRERQ